MHIYPTRPHALLRSLMKKAVWRVPTREKKIYLTFDDGPVPEVTPLVLEVLKAHDAKATFFCVGENVKKNPALFERLTREGHAVANHSYNHLNGWKTSNEIYFENIARCSQLVQSALFRPPYGKLRRSQYSMLSTRYSIIMWDVLSGDFDQRLSKEKCLNNVLRKTRPGSIVLFHDSIKARERMMYALPEFLQHFKERGYAFEKF